MTMLTELRNRGVADALIVCCDGLKGLPDAIRTNAIESLNARFRRAVRHRGHFPNEQAAMKILYLVAHQRRPGRSNLIGKTNGWKHSLNALTIHYGDRITNINHQ